MNAPRCRRAAGVSPLRRERVRFLSGLTPAARRGITLIELLMVIFMIGLLVGLLVPAIQAARESGRRTVCTNNLRQIGFALQTYQNSKLVFPPGVSTTPAWQSWCARLLPYLDYEVIRRNPFVHSTVVVRRAVLDRSGGYDERLAVAQDYDLWMRLAPLTTLANLPDALVIRRLLPGRVSATRDGERLRTEARVRWRAVGRGDYPWWCAVYAARPALALALPSPLRRLIRGMRW